MNMKCIYTDIVCWLRYRVTTSLGVYSTSLLTSSLISHLCELAHNVVLNEVKLQTLTYLQVRSEVSRTHKFYDNAAPQFLNYQPIILIKNYNIIPFGFINFFFSPVKWSMIYPWECCHGWTQKLRSKTLMHRPAGTWHPRISIIAGIKPRQPEKHYFSALFSLPSPAYPRILWWVWNTIECERVRASNIRSDSDVWSFLLQLHRESSYGFSSSPFALLQVYNKLVLLLLLLLFYYILSSIGPYYYTAAKVVVPDCQVVVGEFLLRQVASSPATVYRPFAFLSLLSKRSKEPVNDLFPPSWIKLTATTRCRYSVCCPGQLWDNPLIYSHHTDLKRINAQFIYSMIR